MLRAISTKHVPVLLRSWDLRHPVNIHSQVSRSFLIAILLATSLNHSDIVDVRHRNSRHPLCVRLTSTTRAP